MDIVASATVDILSIDGLRDLRLQALHDYWRSLATPPLLPARSRFRPADVARLLPVIALIDVEHGRRFRFRLVGTHVVNGLGGDLTGIALNDLEPSHLKDSLSALVRQACARREPAVLGSMQCAFRQNLIAVREAVALPMAEDGRTVDKLLLGMITLPTSRIGPLSL